MIDGTVVPRSNPESPEIGIGVDTPLPPGAADDAFTLAADPLTARLRLVPAGRALGRMGLDGPSCHAGVGHGPRRRPDVGVRVLVGVPGPAPGLPLPGRAGLVRLPGRTGRREIRRRSPLPCW